MKHYCLLVLFLLSFPFFSRAENDTTVDYSSMSKRELLEVIEKMKAEGDSMAAVLLSLSQRDTAQRLRIQSLEDSLKSSSLRFENLKLELDSVQQMAKQEAVMEMVKEFGESFRRDEKTFCFFLIESPLYYSCNDTLIKNALSLAKLLGYTSKSKKHPYDVYYDIYDIFKPLLEHYAEYSTEIALATDDVVRHFRLKGDKINRKEEKATFEQTLKISEYYAMKGTGKHPDLRHIVFLDYRIMRILSLFDDEKTFKPENFEKEYKKLIK